MIAQFKQVLCNKDFTLRDQGKDDQIDTLENRNKFRFNIINNAQGPVRDDIYNFDYNDEGLDHSVRGKRFFPEIRLLKNFWIYSVVKDSEIS